MKTGASQPPSLEAQLQELFEAVRAAEAGWRLADRAQGGPRSPAERPTPARAAPPSSKRGLIERLLALVARMVGVLHPEPGTHPSFRRM